MKTIWRPKSLRDVRIFLAVCIGAAAMGAAFLLDSAGIFRVQSRVIAMLASDLGYSVAPGASDSIRFAHSGPYDHRLGYSALPRYIDRLAANYGIEAQARLTPLMARTIDWGLFAPYREKNQAGLAILDCRGEPLFKARYPERVYARFDDIPRVLVDSLLFVENRNLLDEKYPHRNPAIDVERLFKAMLDQSFRAIDSGHETSGGSTLATQIEKYRHSPMGRTADATEKIRQMASASLRAYLAGEETLEARRQLVVNYLNTVPLAAKDGYGEVNGLGDGLWVWFGRDWDEINRLLRPGSEAPLAERALAFKQALALLMAERRPSFYLNRLEALEARAKAYLGLLAEQGIIAPELRDAALAQHLLLRKESGVFASKAFVSRKASSAARTTLASLLGTPRLYDLDRLDLTAHSTLDSRLQEQVSAALAGLNDPRTAAAAGLVGPHMLEGSDPRQVLYSFILYERTPDANLLRVQADNLNQPWDVNAGAKLDLGSTAKARTLLTYLNIVADLHDRYADRPPQESERTADPRDKISQWALQYLATAKDRSLEAMLDAALDRKYSANPGEAFFTGGGVHYFENFDPGDDARNLAVREALRRSVNLVFVRLMRDVVRYFMFNMDGSSQTILSDADDPRRRAYLSMHADEDGRTYLRRFHEKYRGKTPKEALALLVRTMRATPAHLAATLRYIDPDLDERQFGEQLVAQLSGPRPSGEKIGQLYRAYAPERFDLNDRGYLTQIHPLELWLLRFLRQHPAATFAEASAHSAMERQEIYKWLFKASHKRVQDTRIATIIERQAFAQIHRDWQRLGYPFDSLVPSYASALGASADRPAALAELMGILLDGGVRRPATRIERLEFAVDTPYETRLAQRPAAGERVLRPEIASLVRRLLAEVVKGGTAQRLHRVFKDSAGVPLPIGGKTGTGDHRLESYGKGGRLIASRAVGRSGTFVFYLGDRHFGSLTAYVRGPAAAKYSFTSSLPLQVMKALAPVLSPVVAAGGEHRCGSPVATRSDLIGGGTQAGHRGPAEAPGS